MEEVDEFRCLGAKISAEGGGGGMEGKKRKDSRISKKVKIVV